MRPAAPGNLGSDGGAEQPRLAPTKAHGRSIAIKGGRLDTARITYREQEKPILTFSEIIHDPKAFDALMDEIDSELKSEEVAIPGRPLVALMKICARLHCAIALGSAEGEAINNWFVERYGDRLKKEFQIGEVVVRIKGDPYRTKLPVIYGTVHVNPLAWIEGVAPGLWKALSQDEIEDLAQRVLGFYEAFTMICKLPRQCTIDIDTAVHHLMQETPESGLSRWASLQAAEKTLKEFVRRNGGQPPTKGGQGHNLAKICELAQGVGLPPVDPDILSTIQCSPGVRYDVPVTLDEAIEAHHASVELCRHVAISFPFSG